MTEFETIHKYREQAARNHNEHISLLRQRSAPREEIESARAAFTLQMSMLDLAWHYHIMVEALPQPPDVPVRLAIPEHPLWIDFSESLPCPRIAQIASLQMTAVAAFWFSLSVPGSKHWQLELVDGAGKLIDYLIYDALTQGWSVSPMRAGYDGPQERNNYTKHWRKRFLEGVRLMQQNDFRPGILPAPDWGRAT